MNESGAAGVAFAGAFLALLLAGVVVGLVADEAPVPIEASTEASAGARPGPDDGRGSVVSTITTTTTSPGAEAPPRTSTQVPAAERSAGTSPAGPAMAGPEGEAAIATAERVLWADLVGEGREEFGDYWGEGLHRPCCREVVVHSGVARPTAREGTAAVSLVWSAERIDAGVPLEQVGTEIYLAGRDRTWRPVHPAEGGI
jgi:hypothetical protein